jgi:hypothetical protein
MHFERNDSTFPPLTYTRRFTSPISRREKLFSEIGLSIDVVSGSTARQDNFDKYSLFIERAMALLMHARTCHRPASPLMRCIILSPGAGAICSQLRIAVLPKADIGRKARIGARCQ